MVRAHCSRSESAHESERAATGGSEANEQTEAGRSEKSESAKSSEPIVRLARRMHNVHGRCAR